MPSMSHSRSETADCLKRYEHNYILGTERAPNSSFFAGTPFHKAAEMDGLAALAGEPRLKRAELMAVAWDSLVETIAKDDKRGLVTWAGVHDITGRIEAIIDAYIEELQPRYVPTAKPETPLNVAIPGSRWDFTGFMDGQALWDGEPAILDFKTANKPWKPGAEHYKPQATAYQWATRATMGEAAPRKVVFCVFSTERRGSEWVASPSFLPTSRTDAQLNAYPAFLNSVIGRIERAEQDGDYPAKVGPLCSYCAFWHACPEGQAYTGEARKPEYTLPILKGASQ